MFRIIVIAILIAMIPSLASAQSIPQPDSITVSQPFIFPDLIETGDFLIIARYDISYSTIPSANSQQAFVLRLINNSQGRLTAVPFVRDNSGYELSVVSFYMTAAQASELLIAPDDDLEISVEGSPLVFSSPKKTSVKGLWRTNGVGCGLFLTFFCSSVKDQLKIYIETVSNDLKADWGVEVTETTAPSGSIKFTPVGEAYFTETIPQLLNIVPEFFSQTVRTAGTETVDRTFSTAEADDREGFLDNTSISNFFQVIFEDTFKIPKTLAMTVTLIIFGILVAAAIRNYTGHEIAGFLSFVPVVVVGGYLGMAPLQFVTILGAMGVVMIIWTLFLKRTD